MSTARSYSDSELARAIAAAHSWRGTLRALGLVATSSGAMRSVRRRADELRIDYGHFTGQRRWSDADLAHAVAAADSWTDVLDRLGLASVGGSAQALVKAHAARLGLDVRGLSPTAPIRPQAHEQDDPGVRHLGRAAALLAASWFTLHGWTVSWPLESARYDLIVASDQTARRVQVKSTTRRSHGAWVVRIASTRRRGAAVYTPDEVDDFFIVDGEMTFYLIPLPVVGGYQAIHLSHYVDFIVGHGDSMLRLARG